MNARIDLDAVLAQLGATAPDGEDLEYTPEFAALELAATGKPEQQVGDVIVPAALPDWQAVIDGGVGLLARTSDLRIACRLAQALLHVEGLRGFAAGLALVRRYMELQWDALHPRLDPQDDLDPAIRVNAIALLCNVGAVINPLRQASLLRSSVFGAISLNVIAAAHAQDDVASRGAPGVVEIDAAFQEIELADLGELVQKAGQAHDDALAIEAELARRVGASRTLDFAPLTKVLAEINSIAAPRFERRSATAGEQEILASAPAASSASTPRGALCTGPMLDRDCVLRALDAMSQYFAQHEPCHPMPILLERARRWMGMDYMALLHDLAPEAAAQAEKLRGATH